MPKQSNQSPKAPVGSKESYKQMTTLIESVKSDNLMQFGEIKKEFGGVTTQLGQHHMRISELEEDKIKRDAIEEYKRLHPEVAQGVYNSQRKQADDDSGAVTINKELLTALKYLGLVVAALAAAITAMKVNL